jgi:DNA-binding NarL/FixJ family response regulator
MLLADACHALGDDMTAGLELAAARRTFAQLGARSRLAGRRSTSEPDHVEPDDGVLTDRELQMLRRIARGATNPEIADEMFVSVKTVERHVSNILRKLDVPNRAAATAAAFEMGLMSPE